MRVEQVAVRDAVREAFPEVEHQGFLELLDGVFKTGKPFVGKDVKIVFQQAEKETADTLH